MIFIIIICNECLKIVAIGSIKYQYKKIIYNKIWYQHKQNKKNKKKTNKNHGILMVVGNSGYN